ncbi:LAME_0G15236g1_1 [Lachancea meyersii CBS 8951]|uniref:LAME_0G15236g1_1 n=1 Tax=Lachancea meyersii CBS 8951 TaxID=1266667 RepID=A0A1G4KAN2_9SACH|nr:LAME_0G15236g1_1 [Lachancea meyersii CBS 8951]
MSSSQQISKPPNNPRSLKSVSEVPSDASLARLMKPPSSNIISVPAQSGCSTLQSGGYRNKVALKPGHSAMDWSSLSISKGRTGALVTGIDKLISDPEICKINNPQVLMALKQGLPAFKIYPPLNINLAHLKQHKTADDCWCVLGNKVYCITAYLDFHPGGVDILLRSAAGKNATVLFDKYHRWVNYEKLLEHCYVGICIS